MRLSTKITLWVSSLLLAAACGNNSNMGTYGYDLDFLASRNIPVVELKSSDALARVLVVPAFQGRVMTSTAGGLGGASYGWLNHKAIAEGPVNPRFNPFGGEERFWIGPEGGPFSWYFKPGDEQVYANWDVPAFIDSEPFETESSSENEAVFSKDVVLTNASGVEFHIGVRRMVHLLERSEAEKVLGCHVSDKIRPVVYRTINTLTNLGPTAWTRETGMPSVWLLGMYPPTPSTVVFIPFREDHEGKIVNDEYFGKVPEDRLVVKDGFVYFRIDGKYRAKIGLPAGSAKDLCGSYDPVAGVLNILKYTVPQGVGDYVNSQWGPQEDPFGGDVINSYNDGPTETGVVMGPFYEIETSSPGAALAPGESLTHTQYTFHLEGAASELEKLAVDVFGAGVKLDIFRKGK
ncbi:MAG: hypothetical protein IJ840_09940 [Bacteroidales bacterium]|nr:hypothetical protein [Bacteroidales bacterium]